MSELSYAFSEAVLAMGMKKLQHPIFYTAPIGIRFEIGGDESVYLEDFKRDKIVNPAYVEEALKRVMTIYKGLSCQPDLLRIDGYPDESGAQEIIQSVCCYGGLPLPHQQVLEKLPAEDDSDEQIAQLQLYWDLSKLDFHPDKLLHEIIMGDIGGYSGFVSSVFFLNVRSAVLFHLYDDRGLDVVAAEKGALYPLYGRFNDWILDFDREKIDSMFTHIGG